MTIAKAARRLNLSWQRRAGKSRRRAGRTRPGSGVALPALLLLSDPARLPDPIPHLGALPRGSGVILRCYDGSPGGGDRLARVRSLRSATRARGILLLVAGDDRLALTVAADGIHLAEWRIGGGRWRRHPIRNRGGIVTAACHGRAAVLRAVRAGADAALLAPVFPTESHPEARAIGPVRLAAIARRCPIPVYALGGIGPGNAARLKATGAAGIAGIGGIAGGASR